MLAARRTEGGGLTGSAQAQLPKPANRKATTPTPAHRTTSMSHPLDPVCKKNGKG
ncbi:MAG: hypothetical protein HQL56_07610 [Magnetococcales bacterium]|nr:hypothetical protein [Magnetococcales bacterium]